jgi:hypothetical protein
LLILAHPEQVSWAVQAWIAGMPVAVGRIDPDMPGISHYVAALLDGWTGGVAEPNNAALWSVTDDDIGRVTRDAVATPIAEALTREHCNVNAATSGSVATNARLVTQLQQQPGLVVTTSHGAIPANSDGVQSQLGVPIDSDGELLDVTATAASAPRGAVWYILACCSAGSTAPSFLAPLFKSKQLSASLELLRTVETFGSQIAPLPTALLGSEHPARGVVAQVELTFDWMVSGVATTVDGIDLRPNVSGGLTDGATNIVTGSHPVGAAIYLHHAEVGGLLAQRLLLNAKYNDTARPSKGRIKELLTAMLRSELGARNRMSTVLLGDPTASF